ncbi:MAG: glycosyltransferase family 2 protein [Candidatus Anammoxibacter sp.]
MKLSVIVPIFNEKNSILEIIKKVEDIDIEKEIILIDDYSNDGTREIIKDNIKGSNIIKLYHSKNLGKGAAIRTGIEHVTGDIVIIQDADMEYDPSDYFSLIEPITRGDADVVYGSRLSGGAPQRVYMFWHLMGNRFLSFVTNILYNTTLTDMETGYKVFRTDVIKSLGLKSNRFEIEPEITAKIFKRKYRVYELPIAYYGRTYEEGKKITWRDGFSALWTLVKYRFVG